MVSAQIRDIVENRAVPCNASPHLDEVVTLSSGNDRIGEHTTSIDEAYFLLKTGNNYPII